MDLIDEIVNNIYKKKIEDIENTIIDFLKKHGYRPKRTAKYMQNLQKRLRKKGLEIQLIEHKNELKLKDGCLTKEWYVEPVFVEIDNKKTYRIEIYCYGSKQDTYENDNIKNVLEWYIENWYIEYENGGCIFYVYENDREMTFGEKNELGFFD